MMIKEVAEEIGVHPSTVSRAVASKYVHTPQGVYELRFFFSEAVQGIAGSVTPLLILKRRVKKMIEEEDSQHPHRRADHGSPEVGRNRRHPKNGCKIPGRYEDSVHASAADRE